MWPLHTLAQFAYFLNVHAHFLNLRLASICALAQCTCVVSMCALPQFPSVSSMCVCCLNVEVWPSFVHCLNLYSASICVVPQCTCQASMCPLPQCARGLYIHCLNLRTSSICSWPQLCRCVALICALSQFAFCLNVHVWPQCVQCLHLDKA